MNCNKKGATRNCSAGGRTVLWFAVAGLAPAPPKCEQIAPAERVHLKQFPDIAQRIYKLKQSNFTWIAP